MKNHSIDPPKNKPRKGATHSGINKTSKPVTSPGHIMPMLIQPPIVEKAKKSTRSNTTLKGVNITTQTGMVVYIPEINHANLAELILSCNTR